MPETASAGVLHRPPFPVGGLPVQMLPGGLTSTIRKPINGCRWFGAKARTLRQMRVLERSTISSEPNAAQFWFVEVSYLDGPTETYALPVKILSDDQARSLAQSAPHAVIARFSDEHDSILFDAVWDTDFREKLFRLMLDRQHATGKNGQLVGTVSRVGVVDVQAG